MIGLGTFARTVRYLRPAQILGRFWFHVYRPAPVLAPAPPRRRPRSNLVLPARRMQSLFPGGLWHFLNRSESLDEVGWDSSKIEKLWRYNLHYFDDLNAFGAPDRSDEHLAMLAQWISGNPPGKGTGWEPYPTSLRIVNWIKWALTGGRLDESMLQSLVVQVRWVRARIERHLQGNHLFANYKALLFAGLFFDGDEAQRWLAFAQRGLRHEIDEQILPDGGQFERSPMYHALALEDVLDLVNALECFAPESELTAELGGVLRRRLPAMLHWLRAMSHPDGALAHFNDCAAGIAPGNAELERYAAALGVYSAPLKKRGNIHLRDSGYVRVSVDGAVAFLDVAPIGPDYLPGHAHADSLSMELSIGNRRVIVNGGTSCYGTGAQRHHERSTAAHSTVEVAGCNSSEVWSGFRVGRRARIRDLTVCDQRVSAAHDGYRFLDGKPLHRREWTFGERTLDVHDRIDGAVHPAIARFHLSPGLHLRETALGRFEVCEGDEPIAVVFVLKGNCSVKNTLRAVAFGVLRPAVTLEVVFAEGVAHTRWTW